MQYSAALRFFFVKTLKRRYLLDSIPLPKEPRKLPSVLSTLSQLWRFLARRRYVRAIGAMQDKRDIVSAMGQHIPQWVLSQPVSIPSVAIWKTVNATAYRHDLKIH